MSEEWLIQRGGQELGPMRSEVLRQLAATGQLRPSDHVRRTDMGHFIRAGAVHGLFASAAGHHAHDVAEGALPAPHHEKKPEAEVPTAPVAAAVRPVPWARIKTGSQVASVCVVALVSLILLASALRHRGDGDPGTDVVADGPAEGAPAPQGAGDVATSVSEGSREVPVAAKVAVEDVRPAPRAPDELSDELRALPPDQALARAADYLAGPETEANKRTAFLLLQKTANAGDGRAMVCLADCYTSGIGTPASRAEAIKWLRKSAEAGEPAGMFDYSSAIRRGECEGLGESDGMAWLSRKRERGASARQGRARQGPGPGRDGRRRRAPLRRRSNNDDSDDEKPACQQFGCRCGGYERAGVIYKGGRPIDPDDCWICNHDKSAHRR